ncbi:hypothetical protein NM688_g3293 [Phlebia brevispora]|uniref:Uncharacterized protein n=1 Tax=Phlebia brevispora TaxID=194682 RepID=A0ACC1T6D6_9APHY|nr:hypothetical protein NM688_g3293 [Phlebia brevispora]
MAAVVVDAEIVVALRNAVRDCSERGLAAASKWASELLLSIPAAKRSPPIDGHVSIPGSSTIPQSPEQFAAQNAAGNMTRPCTSNVPRHEHAPPLRPPSPQTQAREAQLQAEDADSITIGKALMDNKEYSRAIHWLKNCKSAKATFLRVYSMHKASEKKAIKEWYKVDNTKQQPILPVNPELLSLLQLVRNSTDPWLLFLKALFLSRVSRREEAIESALLSIAGYPWNWAIWILLSECIDDGEELSALVPLLPLPSAHPLVQMFQIKTLNSLNNPSENELGLCDKLLHEDRFPGSLWIMSLRACVLYHLHDFGQAEAQFKKIWEIDPYRIDDIDIYSNILYVAENKIQLSKLAHEFIALDKDRPEVCCLVGNHYSLHAEHEKAIKYFKRATQLDRTYLSAWTLMGHEYVEVKNSHAAIEAYRKAVEVNRKDYRAWYGLGQAYELLSMHQYALYYYQHATALRPYDVRIWQAQGLCYEEMGRPREAIECLKRALIGADPSETTIHMRLAKLYHEQGEYAEAAGYHQHNIDVGRAAGSHVNDYARSSVYVARYHLLQGGGDLELAKDLMEEVASSNSEEVAQGTDLLKKIKVAIVAKQQHEVASGGQARGEHMAGQAQG